MAGTALLSEGTGVSSTRQDLATVSAPTTIEGVVRSKPKSSPAPEGAVNDASTNIMRLLTAALIALGTSLGASSAHAQSDAPPPPAAQGSGATQTPPSDDPDRSLNLAQPDFTLAALPTTLRVPRHKSAFRVTHRFGRPLGRGDFGSLLEDFFGFDSGAQIGLEYRYGLLRGTQVGIYRTSDRTIQFFAQHDLRNQRSGFPVGIAIIGLAEGTNNFRDSYSPGIGAIVSRELGNRGALYIEPVWINNTNPLPDEVADDNSTMLLGLGARLRVRPTMYVFVEASPRVAGFDPSVTQVSFGLEKRAGGHSFQINFSNGIGTTFAQIARGGASNDDWFIGFNISRKFF